jgi:t-SNARE complex subunit (syntaxin)
MYLLFIKRQFIYILPDFINLDINPKETMKNYELMLIINPNASEDDRTVALDNVKGLIEKSS